MKWSCGTCGLASWDCNHAGVLYGHFCSRYGPCFCGRNK